MLPLLLWALLVAPMCAQTMRIQAHNAASFQPGIVPGSLVEIWLVPQQEMVWLDRDQKISVRTRDGVEFRVLEVRHSASVLVLAPSDLPIGPTTLTLRVNDKDSEPFSTDIVYANPGIFTLGFGSGPARAINGLTKPAAPGDILTLWGTGFGSALPDVSIGNILTAVHYAGPAPGFPGLEQLNVIIPSSVPANCYTPVQITAGGRTGNAVTITTGSRDTPCTHPLGLSPAQMARLDAGDSILFGSIGIYSLLGPAPRADDLRWDRVTLMDHADATFLPLGASAIAFRSRTYDPEPGQCVVSTGLSTAGIIGGGLLPEIDIGGSIRLSSGSKSAALECEGGCRFLYRLMLPTPEPVADPAALPPSFWTPGTWTVEAPGGSNAGPFRTEVNIPPAPRVLNLKPLSVVERARGLTLEWNPQGYAPGQIVSASIAGATSFVPDAFSRTTGHRTVTCAAEARDGRIAFSPADLAPFDATEEGARFPPTVTVSLSSRLGAFDIPHTGGVPVRTIVSFAGSQFNAVIIR